MTRAYDLRLGRLLVMALHQAIAEELPTRADFYEHWLGPDRWRESGLGQAPMAAVLGFLRTEGQSCGRVMTRAGHLTGEWGWESRPAWRRKWVCRLPKAPRRLVVAAWLRQQVTDTCPQTTAIVRLSQRSSGWFSGPSGGQCDLTIVGSVFCGSREKPAEPLCGFYAAMAAAVLTCAQMPASGRMEQCCAGTDRGSDDKDAACTGRLTLS
jgi:hypothetical protein